MEKLVIIKKIEDSAHHFLYCVKTEYASTKEAALIMEKYLRAGRITHEEEHILKAQLVDSLKLAGVVVPFVLIPGASILMPVLVKVAARHNIELLPAAFRKDKKDNATAIEA